MNSGGANNYDAVVIGGGHNGLVAAAYLAKYGKNVVVLEARDKTGGAAESSNPWPEAPDITVTTLSYTMSLMPDYILRDLRLKDFGYKINPLGMGFLPLPDGRCIREAGTPEEVHASYAQFSKKDADALDPFYEWIGRIANIMHPLLNHTPPHVGSMKLRDLKETAQLGWLLKKQGVADERTIADITRLFTMSAADLLARWFESEVLIGMMSVNGIIGTWAGPMEPGTAYVLMHHSTGEESEGQVASWGQPAGGMGTVSDAIRGSAEAFGATIRTNAPVEKVLVKNGHAVGAVVAGGEEFHAPVVITACHPQITFLRQIDRGDLPAEFVEDIELFRSRSGTVKINLALDRLPEFPSAPGFDPDIQGAAISIMDDLNYLEKAFEEARSGRAATLPFSDCEIPSVYDDTLAPEGIHVMSMFTQWVPEEWADEPHTDELNAYADRLFDRFDDVAPGFKSSILHKQVIGPYEMEQEWGLIGGNIFHGELTVDQLFHMRPAVGYADYRTPLKGLYQASSATHAGGGVNGLPGHHVVREIRKDHAL
jgi:phytoene dehydrogenase-like protein